MADEQVDALIAQLRTRRDLAIIRLMLDGGLRGDDFTPLEEGRLDGRYIQFSLGGSDYVGEVADDGKTMQGTLNGGVKWRAVREAGG